MIYTDGYHLVADSLDELHEYARFLGLRKKWFQDHPRHPHYDLTTKRMAELAIHYGAQVVSSRKVVEIARRMKRNDRYLVDSATETIST